MAIYPDISHWKPVKNWSDVKKNCPFIISKATQGTTYVDPTLKSFVSQCEKEKVPYWLYTFLNKGNEAAQAKFMVNTCKPLVGKYFRGYILDVESGNTASGVKSALQYIEGLGGKCMLYTMYSQYATYKAVISGRGKNTAWWEARYGANNGKYNTNAPCHDGVDLHQYTSKGTCPGIGSDIDLNRLTGKLQEKWFTDGESTVVVKEDNMVKIGSARIDENGKTSGGKAGDQTGNEVGTQNWYLHSKGWVVLRAKSASVAEKIAYAMQRACDNPNIGYDQGQRSTLYNLAAKVGFDPGKVTTKCETDCSALVRVCLAYAGIKVADFNTATEVKTIMATGKFEQLPDAQSKTADYLHRGDILVTKTKGHTVVVLSAIAKAVKPKTYTGAFPSLPSRGYYMQGDGSTTLKTHGAQIKRIQQFLNWAIDAKLDVDGRYGPKTAAAVKKFQKATKITQDGKFGKDTLAKAKSFAK